MRYLLDTNIFVYAVSDPDLLSRDVKSILEDYDSVLCISVESVRELIVAFKNKGLGSKLWKTAEQMVDAIENEFYLTVLPIKKEHLKTFAKLRTNNKQGHKDPSDHIIISQAITESLPLISSDQRFDYYRKQGLDLIFNKK